MHDSSGDFVCPRPDLAENERVTLAHGEGGRLMRRLIRERILPAVGDEFLSSLEDAAALPAFPGRLAMTTDSFVVSPLFFPGGDIGSLAVYGTVNDLAVAGARPLWISLALIVEEGLPLVTLSQVLASVGAAARRAEVQVVAGDTKVVPRGAADRLFITTTGVGEFCATPPAGPAAIEMGDQILVSGSVGRHGVAVMSAREMLDFEPPPQSDSAPLHRAVAALQEAKTPVRAMRDATRGGLAAVLHEWAEASGLTFLLDEEHLPVAPEVRGVCELLGLDPVHVACEGVMALAVPGGAAEDALQILRSLPETAGAALIGEVQPRTAAPVVARRALGRITPIDQPLGAPLPRIC